MASLFKFHLRERFESAILKYGFKLTPTWEIVQMVISYIMRNVDKV